MTRTRIISLTALFIYIAALCYLCFAKPDDVPSIELTFFGLPIDKVAHFLMFLPFPFLAFKAFDPEGKKNGRSILLLTGIVAAGAGIAALTEFVQGFLEYRSEDAFDLFADFVGLGVGAVAVILYIIFRRLR